MTDVASCRAALISAPASGQGKTTVTAALARMFVDRGDRVTVFKTGPDFLDPTVLAQASRTSVYQLDLFMGGEAHCRALLCEAARNSDVILIEGAMGLFDGLPSSADVAALFGIPVIVVIDASAMAQTFGAMVHGLATYRDDIRVIGAIANRVAGERHAAMLSEAVRGPKCVVPPMLGYLQRSAEIALPERHLGLVQASEVESLEAKLSAAAAALAATFNGALELVEFSAGPIADERHPSLRGSRIAVARDRAFSFLYAANLDLLEQMGAELSYFSPLDEAQLPICDALYLPGGYPELHLGRLGTNESMKQSIRQHHGANKPIVAECGGLLYLLDEITAKDDTSAPMVGLLAGTARMQPRLTALALQTVELPEGTLRGHTYHHSAAEIAAPAIARGVCPNANRTAECVYRVRRLTASYIHFYFPSNPQAVAELFRPS